MARLKDWLKDGTAPIGGRKADLARHPLRQLKTAPRHSWLCVAAHSFRSDPRHLSKDLSSRSYPISDAAEYPWAGRPSSLTHIRYHASESGNTGSSPALTVGYHSTFFVPATGNLAKNESQLSTFATRRCSLRRRGRKRAWKVRFLR